MARANRKSTAGLPLRAGEHYERCPACAEVYRSRRDVRFRCPACHRRAHAIPTPDGEPGRRRVLVDDPEGRTFRVLDARPGEGETPPAFGDDVVVFLESDAPPPAPDAPPSPPPGPRPPPRTRAEDRAAVSGQGSTFRGVLGAVWRGSLSDLRRRG